MQVADTPSGRKTSGTKKKNKNEKRSPKAPLF